MKQPRFFRVFVTLCLVLINAACQSEPAQPVSIQVNINQEFNLNVGQSAVNAPDQMTITLLQITGDERCPQQIECAMSGPVSLLVSVQISSNPAVEYPLQAFTNYDGKAPEMEFEGIQDRLTLDRYLIRIISITPYPQTLDEKVQQNEYQVGFIILNAP